MVVAPAGLSGNCSCNTLPLSTEKFLPILNIGVHDCSISVV